jgi:hypothetical protein
LKLAACSEHLSKFLLNCECLEGNGEDLLSLGTPLLIHAKKARKEKDLENFLVEQKGKFG